MLIESLEEIEAIIQWYVCRWEIEIYFRVLKNGCQVQKLQLETQARFEACLGIYMIAKLGGYLGRKNDGPAGTKTVWIGIQRMRDFTLAISGYKKALE